MCVCVYTYTHALYRKTETGWEGGKEEEGKENFEKFVKKL